MFNIFKPPFLDLLYNVLNIKENGIYIDCTFGCGYHSLKILEYLSKEGRLYSFDCDPISINLGKNKIKDKRLVLINDNFCNIKKYVLKFNLLGKINGIIFDLGISTLQLDDYSRGFSYLKNGPLDMRMNQNYGFPLSKWINKASKKNIYKIIKNYSQDKYSKKISNYIFNYIKKKKIFTTLELSNLIKKSLNNNRCFKTLSRIFQSFRIFINNELDVLRNSLYNSYDILSKKGRLVVISFHSLEDRIVKKFIKEKSDSNYLLLNDLPLTYNQIKYLNPIKMINLGKFKCSYKEILLNNRIRSSLLRVAEKI